MRTLAHIGYVVPDMGRALKRWQKEGAILRLGPTDDPVQQVSCALLEVDGAGVELVAPLGPDAPIRARLDRGGGLDHLCYYVEDLEAAVAEEEARGAIVVCAPVYAVTFDTRIAFVHRKSGLVVELMEGSGG